MLVAAVAFKLDGADDVGSMWVAAEEDSDFDRGLPSVMMVLTSPWLTTDRPLLLPLLVLPPLLLLEAPLELLRRWCGDVTILVDMTSRDEMEVVSSDSRVTSSMSIVSRLEVDTAAPAVVVAERCCLPALLAAFLLCSSPRKRLIRLLSLVSSRMKE